MRTYEFAPLFRSTVGFDRLFDMLDNSSRPDWPPYNIERVGENDYRISMAVAGFAPGGWCRCSARWRSARRALPRVGVR